ncbi:hypothetical protein Tco_0027610 [Tanacetum coccineum]
MWLVKPGLKDFSCGGGDAMMSYRWSAVTSLKNLCYLISGHAPSYDSSLVAPDLGFKVLWSKNEGTKEVHEGTAQEYESTAGANLSTAEVYESTAHLLFKISGNT